jgi:PST family polysaccharide transporter
LSKSSGFLNELIRSSIGKNFFALSIWQLTNYLIPLLTIPYLIRVIGPEKFGVVSLIQAMQYFFIIFVDYGFGITTVKDLSVARQDAKQLSIIFSRTIFTKLILGIISLVIVTAVILIVPKFRNELPGYFLGFLLVVGQLLFPIWFFQGIEQMKFITYLNLVSKVLFTICIFIFIKEESDYLLVLPIQGMGVIMASLVGFYVIVKKFEIRFALPKWASVIHEIKSGFPVFISNFSVTAFNSANYLILAFFGDDIIVGMFSIAEKITTLFRQVLSMLSQAIFPKVCQLAIENHGKLKAFWRKLVIPFASMLFTVCLLIAIFSSYIVNLISGENLQETALLLKIIIWVPFIVFFNIPFFQTLLAYNFRREVMKVLTIYAMISILLSILLTQQFLAIGTVISILITELGITAGLMLSLERKQPYAIL